ncbi:hypothetical protein ACFQ1I_42100 [Kitasatospora arboriphila]
MQASLDRQVAVDDMDGLHVLALADVVDAAADGHPTGDDHVAVVHEDVRRFLAEQTVELEVRPAEERMALHRLLPREALPSGRQLTEQHPTSLQLAVAKDEPY